MPRDAFEGYDEPVKIDMDPDEALKALLKVRRPAEAPEDPRPQDAP
jgi:hypothetical protein